MLVAVANSCEDSFNRQLGANDADICQSRRPVLALAKLTTTLDVMHNSGVVEKLVRPYNEHLLQLCHAHACSDSQHGKHMLENSLRLHENIPTFEYEVGSGYMAAIVIRNSGPESNYQIRDLACLIAPVPSTRRC
jgi:hypothetical protein